MEELDNKLNSNNPILVAQIISKIIQNIKEKYRSGNKETPELKFLKERCLLPDPVISDVAGRGIIHLVEDEILQIETTLADFITAIPLTKCYSSLTYILGNLLYLEMKSKLAVNKEYKNPYNLWLQQHPFVTMLHEESGSWKCIFNEIRIQHTYENGKYAMDLLKPVYLYAICSPVQKVDLQLFKQRIWTFLLHNNHLDSSVCYDVLCWLQLETKNNVETNSELLNEALISSISSNKPIFNIEVLMLWQMSVLYQLTLYKLDIRPCIHCLSTILEETNDLVTINCLLLMASKTIEVCSSIYLLDLLNLCEMLLSYDGKELYILQALKASVLQWLASPSLLTAEAHKVANSIFTYLENYKCVSVIDESAVENFFAQFKTIIGANSELFISVEISLLLQRLKEENNILQWLYKIENAPFCLIRSIYNFLCGLFLTKTCSSGVLTKVFSIILKYVEHNKLLSAHLLTLILYKLSNTTDSKLHFALLKALPKMVVLRENMPKVMATLQALSNGSVDLHNFSLSLMYDAWKLDYKCYSYLENMLIQSKFTTKKWETYVAKTYILKELCQNKPELYGKDMVAHLSKILNECNDADGALPCALAIEGITILCRAEVIDVITTWATLSPKFKNDTRIPVIKSLCSLIHEIPCLPYTESYSELRGEVVRTLWDYVKIGDPQINEAALSSLTSFSLEEICTQLPDIYLDEDVQEERKASVVGMPLTVPGRTWINFLKENGLSKEAVNFLIRMISIEVAGYLKYVYQVKGPREPLDYGYLPTHSIVRGIGGFLKTWATKWKNSHHDLLYIECLRIFSEKYSKPLPPLDWCFLQELLYDPRTKHYCIDIASHQAILSGTARRLVENYIFATNEYPQENHIMDICRNLKHLANSIQPVILKPFIETAIGFATNKYETEYEDTLLVKVLEYLSEVLQGQDIQETNKETIAQVLTDKISIIDIKSKLFDILLQCVITLPKKFIEEMTALKPDVSEEWLEKATKIRCTVALHTNITPLSGLNEVIEICSTIERNRFTFQEFSKVFRKHVNNVSECALWLLELISQIQAKVADRCAEKEIEYFFDVFILTVVEFSGYSTFIISQSEDCDVRRRELFPQAFNALMKVNDWSVCTTQALEWLHHMNTEETVPSEYRNIFGLTLQTMRHDDEFIKNFRWMKYLSSKIIHKVL